MEKFDYIQNKLHLIDVYQETVNAVLNGKYTAPDGTVVELGSDREMRENSRFYSRRFTVRDIPAHKEPTKVELLDTDSISAGKQLLDEGYNPVVLNFANAYNPGGGVINGSRAPGGEPLPLYEPLPLTLSVQGLRRGVRRGEKQQPVSSRPTFWRLHAVRYGVS